MEFLLFLQKAFDSSFWRQSTLYCFVGNEYPLLFFSLLFRQVRVLQGMGTYQRIDLMQKQNGIATVRALLSQCFLGKQSFYWLGNISVLSSKDKRQLLSFLSAYQGPHRVGFFLLADDETFDLNRTIQKCTTPVAVNRFLFNILFSCFTHGSTRGEKKLLLIEKLFTEKRTLSLDQCCMLVHYLELTSLKNKEQFEHHCSRLFESSVSLSLLSQYFFAKKVTPFFKLWEKVERLYPEVFWVSFWAEQLWRAYYVVKFLKNKQAVQARQIGFRLPTSFVTMEWKHFSLEELSMNYEFLYHIDYAIKSGSSFCVFDLFYSNYFLNNLS